MDSISRTDSIGAGGGTDSDPTSLPNLEKTTCANTSSPTLGRVRRQHMGRNTPCRCYGVVEYGVSRLQNFLQKKSFGFQMGCSGSFAT
jgi:hypothetical protein